MYVEEYPQNVCLANHTRVKSDLKDLGMPSITTADLFLGWIFDMAACLATDYFVNSLDTLENSLSAPEATHA